jgi:predicted methyltransferase
MAKFFNEQTLRFDRESMEQATHSAIASYHASNYPKGVTVVDGTAGLGGDAMALVQRGPVIAIENDPSRIEFAKHNLSPLGVEVLQGDVAEYLAIHHPDYVWLDPARRTQTGKRITKLADYLPSPLALWKSLESCT